MPDILLAIDAGNTRIKWGVHESSSGWRSLGAVATAEVAALDVAWHGIGPASRAIASNVAGDAVRQAIESACAALGLSLSFVSPAREALGVSNGYTDFSQLGADRWVALVAAHRMHPGNKLVVNAGTALTVDALAADGRFLGGLIVPGPTLMRRSLDRGTAGLRMTEGRFVDFPSSTPDAITSGAIQACAGAIERFGAVMAARGHAAGRIILSGGAASEVAPALAAPVLVIENLVLEGLALIARHS
jgi:type III pantothenate kinase